MYVLVVNCGSSSLKFQLIELPEERVVAKGLVDRIGQKVSAQFSYSSGERSFPVATVDAPDHPAALGHVIAALTSGATAVLRARSEIGAVGHRVVHGGEKFTGSVVITEEVLRCIEECGALAPLHNPANLAGIRACMEALPGVPNVAVFDTAFHQTMPPHAFHYALPYELYEQDRIRRYGFHGTSHKYVTETFAHIAGIPLDRVCCITCHLGNGSSLAAVENGHSVDTSMGFTPLAGVVMGTRCGDIDPALVFHLMKVKGLGAEQLADLLNKGSGLLGFSGVSSDMRDVLQAAQQGHVRAALAIELWAYSIAKYIGSYAAILPRVDGIIFTAGIGENSALLRAVICEKLRGLGILLDPTANERGKGARCISAATSRISIWVIPTNEELEIARETFELTARHE
ncbi:MAG: acetate kinase [bacterium]|nr:acetate kinase [bacterium]